MRVAHGLRKSPSVVDAGRRDNLWRRRLRFAILCSGSAGLAFAALISSLVVGLSIDRTERMRSLLPVVAQDSQSASLLYRYSLPLLRDRDGVLQPAVAIWISPLKADAPLPPGISAWPNPGEAVVSPNVREDLVGYPADFFGRVVGTISSAGLELPSERRIYVRPTAKALEATKMTQVESFGGLGSADGFWGPPTLYAQPLLEILVAVGLFFAVPAAIAIAIGAAGGSTFWCQDSHRTRAPSARRVSVLALSECWRPLAVGSSIGLLPLLCLGMFNVHIQYLNFTTTTSDVRRWRLAGVCAVSAALIVSLLLVCVSRVCRRWLRKGRISSQHSESHRWALVCVVAGLSAVWLPALFVDSPRRNLMYWVALAIFLITLPAAAAMILTIIGEAAVSVGHKTNRPWLVLVAQGRKRTVRTARVIGAVAGVILLLGQAQMAAGSLGPIYQGGIDQRVTFGDIVLSSHAEDSTGVESFIARLPRDAEPVWTWFTPRSRTSGKQVTGYDGFLAGSCASLSALSITCQHGVNSVDSKSPAMAALSAAVGFGSSIRVILQDSPDLQQLIHAHAQLSLVSASGRDLPVRELKTLANQVAPGGMNFTSLGESAVAGGTSALYAGRWLTLWGVLGILPLILAAGGAFAADAQVARPMAPIPDFSARRARLAMINAGEVWLPLTLIGLLGSLSYSILPTAMTRSSFGNSSLEPSSAYAWACALSCTVMGTALAYLNYRATDIDRVQSLQADRRHA